MAELSQRDKEVLLGQSRVQNAQVDALKAEADTPEKKLETCEGRKMTAAFVIITGLALLIGGFVLNGQQFGFEKVAGAAATIVGVVWYAWLRTQCRRLRASGVRVA